MTAGSYCLLSSYYTSQTAWLKTVTEKLCVKQPTQRCILSPEPDLASFLPLSAPCELSVAHVKKGLRIQHGRDAKGKPCRVSGKLFPLAMPSPAQLLITLEQGINMKPRRLNCSPFNQFLQNNTLIITLETRWVSCIQDCASSLI